MNNILSTFVHAPSASTMTTGWIDKFYFFKSLAKVAKYDHACSS